MVNIDRSQYDEIDQQCGIPPPLREPESLNFNYNLNEVIGQYDGLPAPDYLDENYEDLSSSFVFGCIPTHRPLMSSHEALFGSFKFCKSLKFYSIQACFLLLTICIAWSFINFTSEFISLVAMSSDPNYSSFLVTRRPCKEVKAN